MKKFLLISFVIITIITIIGAQAIYFIESPHDNASIRTMIDAYWWTVATITSIGYGDVVPVTDEGKILGMIYSFIALIIIGLLVVAMREIIFLKGRKRIKLGTPVLENVLERMEELERLRKEDHEKILKLIQSLKEKL